jgi:hypothetical protein
VLNAAVVNVGLSADQRWRARREIAELAEFDPDAMDAELIALNPASWGNPVRVMAVDLGVDLAK